MNLSPAANGPLETGPLETGPLDTGPPRIQPLSTALPEDEPPAALAALEARAQTLGRELFAGLREGPAWPWHKRWWEDRFLGWTLRDERLRAQLFRFVDVLPMLRRGRDVAPRFAEYVGDAGRRLPPVLRAALWAALRVPGCDRLFAAATRVGARGFARKFIAGASAEEVARAALRQRRQGRVFTLDILGEAVTSEREAEQHFQAYLSLLDSLAPRVAAWPAAPRLDADAHGPAPRLNLSVKLSALDSQFDPIDPAGAARRAGGRLRELLRQAKRVGAFVNVDMESFDKKALTLSLFQTILREPEFRLDCNIGIVLQAYLKDSPRDLLDLRDWAAARGAPVWVRLVKGAYWDHETIHAQAQGWPPPVFQRKRQSDANFERLARFLLKNHRHLRPAFGSHNLRSLAHVLAAAEHYQLPPHAFELQMLYGMADGEKRLFVERGQRVRVYMPFGELIPGMSYLVRRLLENTSNTSFLRAGFLERAPLEQLLANPAEDDSEDAVRQAAPDKEASTASTSTASTSIAGSSAGESPVSALAVFQNEPPIDFARADQREAMARALADTRAQLGRHFPLVIAGQRVDTEARWTSVDPSFQTRVAATTSLADETHVAQAVAAAQAALPGWRQAGAARRAACLRAAAAILRRRLFELSAWMVYECGKPWREATNEVCEAIDFCEFYALGAEALELGGARDVAGEENRFEYWPRGVAAVIAPWNFPLAILTGMAAAALATGNTVVLKPAEQASAVAGLAHQIFLQAGVPAEALHYLPGRGETAGAALVAHPDVALIAFTGSRSVGLAIHAQAAELSRQGTRHVKKVIAEMGGKNAILVDADADLDEAVQGVAHSAFGHAGQKCSACSRAIVLADVYDAFLPRLVEAARSWPVGRACDPGSRMGPLIDEAARRRVLEYIEIGKREARLAFAGDVGDLARQGFFVGPHVFADAPRRARVAQEEIFGPVLAVIRARDLGEALHIANDVDYGLTGGVYSRSPANLARARREFDVGNLYLNRPITGAWVARQPFGGFKLSGIGGKAGGADYLLHFVQARTVTENTLRRGFAPPPGQARPEG